MNANGELQMRDALTYEAPYLIEKLLKEKLVDTAAEGEALFTEVKRFLVAANSVPEDGEECSMYSMRVDGAWHQFVLFTHEYATFSMRYFGKFVHHNPSNAPRAANAKPERTMSIEAFAEYYASLFGEPLPDLWYDERTVTPHRRIVNPGHSLAIASAEEGMIAVVDAAGEVLLSVTELARPALEFVRTAPAFYVRELPGDLSDDEKIALVATLVEFQILRVAA